MVRAERGVRGGARQAVPRPRAGDSRADEAGVSVLTLPPETAPSFNPRPERPELNPLLCHYLKTFWINAHISAEDKLFNSLTMK